MIRKRWFTTLFLLFFVAALPQCKSKTEEETEESGESVNQDKEEPSQADLDKAAKKKARKAKKKAKATSKASAQKARSTQKAQAVQPTEDSPKAQQKRPLPTPPRRPNPEDNPVESAASQQPTPTKPQPEVADAVTDEPTTDKPDGPAARDELPENPTIPEPPTRIPVRDLLSITDLTRSLPERGWVSYGPIQGIQPDKFYNSIIYRKMGTQRFVSLQAWDYDNYSDAVEKWNEALATYPNTQELKDLFAELLFFSARNKVISLTLVEPKRSMVLSVACSEEVCTDEALLKLTRTVFERARGN